MRYLFKHALDLSPLPMRRPLSTRGGDRLVVETEGERLVLRLPDRQLAPRVAAGAAGLRVESTIVTAVRAALGDYEANFRDSVEVEWGWIRP